MFSSGFFGVATMSAYFPGALALHAEQLGGIGGHALQDFRRRHAGHGPHLEIIVGHLPAILAGDYGGGVGAESHLHADAVRALQPVENVARIHFRFGENAAGGADGVEMLARGIGAHQENSLVLHGLQLLVGELVAVLDGINARADGVVGAGYAEDVHRHGQAAAVRLGDGGANLLLGVNIWSVVDDQLDDFGAVENI